MNIFLIFNQCKNSIKNERRKTIIPSTKKHTQTKSIYSNSHNTMQYFVVLPLKKWKIYSIGNTNYCALACPPVDRVARHLRDWSGRIRHVPNYELLKIFFTLCVRNLAMYCEVIRFIMNVMEVSGNLQWNFQWNVLKHLVKLWRVTCKSYTETKGRHVGIG